MYCQRVTEKQITSNAVSRTTDMSIQVTSYASDDMYQVQSTASVSLQPQASNRSRLSQLSVYSDGGAVQINEDCYETPPLPSEAREGSYGYTVSIPASTEHTDTMDINHFVKRSSRSMQERPGVSGLADVDAIREEHGDNSKTESNGSENMNMSMININAPESPRRRLSGIITASHGLTDFDKIRNEVRQRYERDEDTDDLKSESNGSESSDGNSLRKKSKESQRLALERERNSVKLALRDYGVEVSAAIDTEFDDSLNFGSGSVTDSDSDHSALYELERDPKTGRPLKDAMNALKSKSRNSSLSNEGRARRGSLIRIRSVDKWTNEELATEQQEMVSQMASLAMHHNNSSERLQ